MTDDDIWFEPKRFGYGAGLPVRWQGWALFAAYVAVLVGLAATGWLRDRPLLLAALIVVVTIPLLVIAARHTRGGWRWRWG